MHYVEYIYLLSFGMIGIFMVVEKPILTSTTQIQLGVAAGICLGMYFYRRKQRLQREDLISEEMKKLDEEEQAG